MAETDPLMKTSPLLFLLSTFYFLIPPSAFPQGSLTAPGAPAPTMKTLDQVEARTPIDPARPETYTITQAGSYYLTGNINITGNNNGIVITADNVTFDLNGFTISATAPSNGDGIVLAGTGTRSNIHILNGHIRGQVTFAGGVFSGAGFYHGISYATTFYNVRVSDITVSRCLGNGIDLYSSSPASTVVESCTVNTVGGFGITADNVSHCVADVIGFDAITGRVVSNCTAHGTAGSRGIVANTASNCEASSVSGQGIYATNASNCYGMSSSSQGIYAETASNCYGFSTSNRGVFANVAISCSGHTSGGSYGVFATSVANTCYGESASGTGLNAFIAIGCTGSSVAYTYHYNMPP